MLMEQLVELLMLLMIVLRRNDFDKPEFLVAFENQSVNDGDYKSCQL